MNAALLLIGLVAPGPLLADHESAIVVFTRVVPASDIAGTTAARHGTVEPAAPQGRRTEPTVVRARGTGRPPANRPAPQARLMARRAAEVRAVRNLAAKLGLPNRARIRGFRYVHTEYRADGSVVVVVEYPAISNDAP